MSRTPRILLVAMLLAALAGALVACGGSGSSTATATSTETVQESTTTQTESTSTDTTSSSTSTTSGEDGAPPPADEQVTKLTQFTSPTGNIGCVIDRGSVRCDIADRDWNPPPRPAGCSEQVDFGQGIELSAGKAAQFVCAGDTTLGAGDALPYGQSIAAGLLRCDSAESGMTCSDAETGRGFSIAKQGYELR